MTLFSSNITIYEYFFQLVHKKFLKEPKNTHSMRFKFRTISFQLFYFVIFYDYSINTTFFSLKIFFKSVV